MTLATKIAITVSVLALIFSIVSLYKATKAHRRE